MNIDRLCEENMLMHARPWRRIGRTVLVSTRENEDTVLTELIAPSMRVHAFSFRPFNKQRGGRGIYEVESDEPGFIDSIAQELTKRQFFEEKKG